MALNVNEKYKPSDKFKEDLSECLSKYVCRPKDKCSEEEYEAMLTELSQIQEKAKNEFRAKNNTAGLLFYEIKKIKKDQMEKSATPEIIKTLQDLRQTRVKNYPLERYDIFIAIKKFSPPIFRILNWLTFYSLVILHILHIDNWPTFKSKVVL
ncbi:unnamed protein product, partial [Adineta steineri]